MESLKQIYTDEMKTIAFVSPWYGENIPGGAEAAFRGITKHLYKAGMNIEILTTTVKQFTSDWNENYYKPGITKDSTGISVRRFKIRKRNVQAFDEVNLKLIRNIKLSKQEENIYNKEMINSPDLYKYIRENIDRYEYFVFIPYMFGTTYWGVQECLNKAVLIPCFHDESYAYMQSFRETFSKIAGMIFNAKPEADLTNRLYDTSNVKTEIIGLGVNTNITYDAERFRKKYNISEPFILYAGRKDEGKNIYTLINYFEEYKKQNKNDLKLVMIGGGEITIPESIQLDVFDLGFVDLQDKYDAYSTATILCQPSKNESFSFVIMESWLCGRPVLVHEGCEVTTHFVKDSNGGLYFKSYYEFQGTINYFIEHSDITDVMGQNGKKYVETHFSWDVIVSRYQEFFRKIGENH